MILLNVPFAQKDEAKSLGARWNADQKKWYVPDGKDEAHFVRWIFKKKELFVDLVPRSAWFSNLRSEVTPEEWDLIRKTTYRAAGHVCEVCGGKGPQHPVECHERWHYDPETGVQTLISTVALCPDCHEATHFGLANMNGRTEEAKQHLMQVNGWSEDKVSHHIDQAMDEWEIRSEINWRLDARWLLNFVQVSDETRKKILDHAAGLAERAIKDWQTDIVEGN